MLFGLIGLALVALGVAVLWVVKPHTHGHYYYPKKYEKWVHSFAALVVTGLIGMGIPFLLFGAPGTTAEDP
jgi:hypothetical protein